jgi:hypothetical protein
MPSGSDAIQPLKPPNRRIVKTKKVCRVTFNSFFNLSVVIVECLVVHQLILGKHGNL